MGWNVLVTSRLFTDTPRAHEILVEAGCNPTLLHHYIEHGDPELRGDELIGALQGMDAIIAGSAQLERKVLEKVPSLKLVARRGVGYDAVDVESRRRNSVSPSPSPPARMRMRSPIDSFTLMLAVDRGVVRAYDDFRAGKWLPQMGVGMKGKTLGIIGLGRIGKGLARRAKGFSMRVIATDPVHYDDFARQNGIEYVELDDLLAQADFVAIHCTLNATSHHLINARTLGRMKSTAVLVNTARGPIVDERALADALRAGKIRAAGIDVFAYEPATDTPLAGIPNVLLTPHNAASTTQSYDQMNLDVAQAVADFSKGILPAPECIIVQPRTAVQKP